jgi:UDP-N-acetylglucosamine 2-epimerase (non-hydrolysing)
MVAVEQVCLEKRPSMLVVAGDVNSTAAGALAAAKLGIPVAHLEAGLRSFDRTMPEELNRIVTDHLSDLLLTSEEAGARNLRREGIPEHRIRLVGNCMVDSLRIHEHEARRRRVWESYGLPQGGYALLTLHRPSNVDQPDRLREVIGFACRIAERMPVVFPVHPRTRENMGRLAIATPPALRLCEPLPYLTFLGLMADARVVLTDSGGIQEETTALGVPCLTLRLNTERPATVELGSNELVGDDLEAAERRVERIGSGLWKSSTLPPLWDGRAAVRVADEIAAFPRPAGSLLSTTPPGA